MIIKKNYLIFFIFICYLHISSGDENGKNNETLTKTDLRIYCTGSNKSKEEILTQLFAESGTITAINRSIYEIPIDFGNFFVVPEPQVCQEKPSTDIDSTINERSLCPYNYKTNKDKNREPQEIREIVCLCRKSRGHSNSFCSPIRRGMAVLLRVPCDDKGERYEYIKAIQSIVVGCHSVFPRIHPAEIIGSDYNSYETKDINP
uniref:Uncharacterized protein n=1 Tax=Parastrongyloides trichosuri TaxID=131310 RepID=A0A0N4Z4Q1_PARTI